MWDRNEVDAGSRKKRRLWIWVVALLSAPILVGLYFVVSAHTGLNKLIAEIDRLDPGWRLEEIEAKRASYPPEQNAAVLILKIKGTFGQQYKEIRTKDDLLRNLEDRKSTRLNSSHLGI